MICKKETAIKKLIGKLLIKIGFKRLAFLILKSYGQSDDIQIIYFLARCYHAGKLCKQNYEKAFYYYSLAAAQQHSWSLVYLGQLFELGNGTERNYVKAFNCYCQAAKLGDARAFNRLGLCYKKGLGTEINPQLEIEAYGHASDKNFIWGSYNLATCYVFGHGVSKDISKAIALLHKKGVRKLPCAQNLLGLCYMHGTTPLEQRKGLKFYRKAMHHGNVDAMTNIGYYYFFKQNYPKAIKYYVRAAKKQHCQAIHSLANCFENGLGVERNPEMATWLNQKADDLGYRSGQM